MTVFRGLTWIETKLFVREPFQLFFALAFPLIILVIMAAIFPMTPYSGAPNSTTYYVPATLGMVIAAVAFVGVPVELAAYRERGVLRRFRASGIPTWALLGSEFLVALLIATIGALLLVAAGRFDGRLVDPIEPLGVVVGLVVGTFGLVGIGLAVGAVLPNARAAQGIGLLLFFGGYLLSGGGPPRDAMPDSMRTISDLDPVTHVMTALQAPWFGPGFDPAEIVLLGALGVVGLIVAALLFRWE
ncbi:MAG: hypothetical protein A2Z32_02995 [Chloroflexi bacterium RBG_16_69_14]|nr:MAG: hypothetical protein A2Z32_02995 [Chloroflexi bacterium RBG_16_69_14]